MASAEETEIREMLDEMSMTPSRYSSSLSYLSDHFTCLRSLRDRARRGRCRICGQQAVLRIFGVPRDKPRSVQFNKQWLKMFSIGVEFSQAAAINRLPHLLDACRARGDGEARTKRSQAECAGPERQLRGPTCSAKSVSQSERKNSIFGSAKTKCQLRHQPFVLADVPTEITEVMRIRVVAEEPKLVDRKANVTRVPSTMDDLCARQQARKEAEMARIGRHLVNAAARFRREGV